MSGFLEKASAAARSNVAAWMARHPEPLGKPLHPPPEFLPAGLKGCSVITEIKRKSPSRGDLMGERDPVCLAVAYEAAGAGAVSIVVEEQYFSGSTELFQEVTEMTALPLLWKDFVVDPFQIRLAASLGASSVLLIAGILTDPGLKECVETARREALSPLVEVHSEEELDRALEAGADLIGVNNRDLVTLEVDTAVSEALAGKIPPGVRAVSESGIKTPGDVGRMAELGYSAVLVGESLITAGDTEKLLVEMVRAGKDVRA